jgi:hypothetical protein
MVVLQANLVITDAGLKTKKIIAIVIGDAIGITGLLMFLANHWMFPVPFAFTFKGLLFSLLFNLCATLALGTSDLARLKRLRNFTHQIGIQTSMTIVYPVYNAIFLTLDGIPQLAFVLLLPVIKIMFKYISQKHKTSMMI